MFQLLGYAVLLHAGTTPVVSQTVLTFMLVVFGILLVGFGFGKAAKDKTALMQHRYILSVVLGLTLIPVAFVMVPTIYRFYSDSDVIVLSSISITQIFHAVVSVPALATAALYAFGKLPAGTKKAMRWTAALWIASVGLGVLMFLQMMEIIPSF
jgi:uncharacterized membrane protein YozB (DUF420 family)